MHSNQDNLGTVRQEPMRHALSDTGLAHIKRFEGLRTRAYDDLNPSKEIRHGSFVEGVLTIGYGHTGTDVKKGMEVSEAEAEEMLLEDLMRFQAGLKRLVKVPISQGEYDALTGFVFNVGLGAFERSTLLRKLNALDYDGASMEFERWVYSGGRKLRGLMLRRVAERSIFTGMAKFSLIDIGEMAAEAEDLLGIGANVQPDAVEGAGLMKPKLKSGTLWGAGSGMFASVIGYAADLDKTVQLALLVAVFGYLMFNRYLEWKAGEH